MSKSKSTRFFLIGLMMMLMVLSVACGNDTKSTDVTPTPEPIPTPENTIPDIGEETFDDMAETAADTVNEGVSIMCKLCQASGDDDCSGVCK